MRGSWSVAALALAVLGLPAALMAGTVTAPPETPAPASAGSSYTDLSATAEGALETQRRELAGTPVGTPAGAPGTGRAGAGEPALGPTALER